MAPHKEGCLIDYASLRPFATPRQLEILDALAKHGTQPKAAAAVGINRRGLERHLAELRNRATLQGFSPAHDMTHAAPDGYIVKGVSTMYTEAGIAAQWVKTTVSQERMLAIAGEIVEAMSSDIKREKPAPKVKVRPDADLLNLFLVSDVHLGMRSWGEETGADWDTSIAEDTFVAWFQKAIQTAPDAHTAVLGQLGDFLHHDGLDAVTPEHGNLLDADSRFEKLVRVAIRALRRVIRMLLEKHEHVHIIMAEGNHDIASSVWLREWFAVLFEDEPRVTVDTSPDPYYAYEWGQTALFLHHGHKQKDKQVADTFASKFRPLFGKTQHAYGHVGHRHQASLFESPLMTVEGHRTIAAPDAYASRSGWMSGRSATCITYSKEFGEVARLTISPELAAVG